MRWAFSKSMSSVCTRMKLRTQSSIRRRMVGSCLWLAHAGAEACNAAARRCNEFTYLMVRAAEEVPFKCKGSTCDGNG